MATCLQKLPGFKNLWLLVQMFNVDLLIHKESQIQGVPKGNQPLMSKFFHLGYRGKDLVSLNIVRCFCNLLHISDITKYDGVMLDKFYISTLSEESALHVFPREEPTLLDFY
jgi:hypothetical protein